MFLFRALVFAALSWLYAGRRCEAANRSAPNEVHTASSSAEERHRMPRLFQLDEEQLKQGIDPLEYIKQRRKHRRRHRRRKPTHNRRVESERKACISMQSHAKIR
jgi:hypothetical protein